MNKPFQPGHLYKIKQHCWILAPDLPTLDKVIRNIGGHEAFYMDPPSLSTNRAWDKAFPGTTFLPGEGANVCVLWRSGRKVKVLATNGQCGFIHVTTNEMKTCFEEVPLPGEEQGE